MKKLLVILFFAVTVLQAGNIKVVQTRKLTDESQGGFFHPKFSPDGKAVFFTSDNYRGLWKLNLQNGSIEQINNYYGAGYKFQISAGGEKLYFRTTIIKNRRRYHSLIEYNLKQRNEKIIENEVRNLSVPRITKESVVFYRKNDELKFLKNRLAKSEDLKKPLVYIENRNLILVHNGIKKKLNPLGNGIYLWPSLSPDGQKVLFTLGGKGTFISDLNGNILVELGYANYPKWSPDGKWILFMRDKDNGYDYTESDLYVSDKDGRETFKLTDTKNEIEMFGEWSPDGTEIVFHNNRGEIYLLKLKIEN